MGTGLRPRRGGWLGIALSGALALAPGPPRAHAEEWAIRAGSLVESRLRIFITGPQHVFTLGVFTGRLVVDGSPSALDGARLSCPASFDADYEAKALRGDGRCVMTTGRGDRLFARWNCAGAPEQGCTGRYVLTGGTGAFQGATGEGQFSMRLVLSNVVQFDRQEVEYDVTAQIVWPELRYRTP